ncbi:MAG TPA: transglycosylase domain-containing protein, partial [Anaerolineales bacterium]|nr:transglycosylase domain-containing protein [Anaerolineales bacterium]
MAFGLWYYFDLTRGLPSINSLPVSLDPPDGEWLQPSRFYDRTHEHVILTLEKPGATDRQYLYVEKEGQQKKDMFSPHLVDATLASLDPGYWSEPVFAWRGITVNNTPTLAQRLVQELLLNNESVSKRRNYQEWLLAGQITALYGREKILEWYLNSAKYGDYVVGADAAARVYLGKPATQLSIAEAALLTAIGGSPGYDPWSSGRWMRDRQVEIIQGMLRLGWINQDEAQAALKENIQIQPEQPIRSLAPSFTNLVLLELSSRQLLERISRGGFEVITTIDYDLQVQATCAVQTQIDRLGVDINQPARDIGLPCDSAQSLSVVQVDKDNPIAGLNTEVIVLDPQSGEILAYVGGDQGDPKAALPAEHQAGSILSPFLYLAAFTEGMSPASLLWDLPETGENHHDAELLASYHGPVRLRIALLND